MKATQRPPTRGAIGVALGTGLTLLAACAEPPAPVPDPSFDNHTARAGLLRYSPTFAVLAADVDGDLRDDLLVGNHGYPPDLFINTGGVFTEATDAMPIRNRSDRHGYTLVDLDNDGDRDFIYAGGGADGIGRGSANRVYRNLLTETGELRFAEERQQAGIALPAMRSRQFLPIANAAGDRVDLYLTSLHKRREGSTNLYFSNTSTPDAMRLTRAERSSLNQPFESNGMDLFFDFDRDGDADFLRLGELQASLYRNDGGDFKHVPSKLDTLGRLGSAAVADFNNDGYMDLYLGSLSGHTHSDNISGNDREIHFSIVNQDGDDTDRISFRSDARALSINFIEHLSELNENRTDPGDIYLGANRTNPAGRQVQVRRRQATGRPATLDAHGTYLWYEKDSGLWQVVWKHKPGARTDSKGIIAAPGMQLAGRAKLEVHAPREVRDHILINQSGRSWRLLKLPALKHVFWTNDVTAADFNNDGLVDIIGLRSRDYAARNGTPFIVLNHGNLQFTRRDVLDNSEDDIFRADLIVHGFFDSDGLPDVFFTNGAGLLPSHRGPYQLWLNSSDNRQGSLVLELQGTHANRDAIGAQVELYDTQGKLLGYRELGPGYGRSQDTHKLHFGLGERQGPFIARIRWPGREDWQEQPVDGPGFLQIRQE